MSDDVDILVLGGTGTGKTCFMLAMYDDMRIGYGGFSFSAVDPDVDRELVDRFQRMREMKGEDRWGLGTTGIETYQFDLNYALRRFLSFNWRDYRGGMMVEAASTRDVSEFRALVDAAHVVMICAPGNLLYDAGIRRNREAQRGLLGHEVGRLLVQGDRANPPIVLLVTMADLFYAAAEKEGKGRTETEWNELLIRAVGEIYHAFLAPGGGLRVLICPVTLGMDLAGDRNNAPIEPKQMHVPMMFAYLEYARSIEADWRRRIAEQEARIDEYDKMFWAPKRKLAAQESLAEAEKRRSVVDSRISIAKDAFPPEDNVLFFVNGKRTSLR